MKIFIISILSLVLVNFLLANSGQFNFPIGAQPDSNFFFTVWNFAKTFYFFPDKPIEIDSSLIIWEQTKTNLVKYPEKNDSIIYANLNRLIKTLPGGCNYFLDPTQTIKQKEDMAGGEIFSGIGVHLVKYENKIWIFQVNPNSPAKKAGLKRGDQIVAVDGKKVDSLTLEEVTKMIRGQENTTVTLSIQRPNETKLIKVIIPRQKIVPTRVKWQKIDENLYYLKLFDFVQNANLEFSLALDSLGINQYNQSDSTQSQLSTIENNKKIFILDLRGNLGGFTGEVRRILGFWTDSITYILVDKNAMMAYNWSNPFKPLANFKTIILTDRNTASAAEILVGALKYWGFAFTVGDTTYGKGSFQFTYDLPFSTMIGLTCGAWLTPSGECIDKKGFAPDFYVKFDMKAWLEKGIDNQLEAAINLAKL